VAEATEREKHFEGWDTDLGRQRQCIRLIQRDTRRFAKRQITWVKAQQDHVFFASADTARRTVSQWLQEEARGPG